ncbi:MAG: hypothetical protein KF736_00655 [Acidobacteria bacterium]|nr:hypothetical protein [Acidobacteriota bacterium]MCW5947984.1 hypothetical protein [Pyrinomonadaceae bacterium]
MNGRPVLVGGMLAKDTDRTNAKIFELTTVKTSQAGPADRLRWNAWDASFPPVQDCGLCSTLGVAGLPSGLAFLFAGHGRFSDARNKIYASRRGGLVATTFDGEPAISIADGSSFVTFEIDPLDADWEVVGYMPSLVGTWSPSNLKLEVSFDDGGHWSVISPVALHYVTHSSDPGRRRLRVTLYNLTSSRPVLSKLIEVLDEDGGALEDRFVIRYNAPAEPKALYLNRDGTVELDGTVAP